MADKHGEFVWYELMTTDVGKAKAFYGDLLGWTFQDASGGMPYTMILKSDAEIGGILGLTKEMADAGAQPAWVGYVEVEDTDAALARALSAGATALVPPTDIPVGRFAMFADPQGAPLYIMQSKGDEASQSFARYDPQDGHCAWNELVTADPKAARAFYEDLFGWEKADEMMMGEMGLYEMFKVSDYTFGAIMQKPEMMPMSAWVYYLRVPDIDGAAEYVSANGGQVMTPPMQIPGGEHILNGMDPTGAFFALIGKKAG